MDSLRYSKTFIGKFLTDEANPTASMRPSKVDSKRFFKKNSAKKYFLFKDKSTASHENSLAASEFEAIYINDIQEKIIQI